MIKTKAPNIIDVRGFNFISLSNRKHVSTLAQITKTALFTAFTY